MNSVLRQVRVPDLFCDAAASEERAAGAADPVPVGIFRDRMNTEVANNAIMQEIFMHKDK